MKYRILVAFLIFYGLFPQSSLAEIVGALMPPKVPYYMLIQDSLEKELKSLSFGDRVILQRPAPNEMAWKNATRKLVTLGARVIVAYGSETAIAIRSENSQVPVVFCGAYDPVECGVSGNVTGMDATLPLQGLVDNLKKISNFNSLGVMYSANEIESVRQLEAVEGLVAKKGGSVKRIDMSDSDSYDLSGIEALLITSAAKINSQEYIEKIVSSARSGKVATASVFSGTCELGVLISMAADPDIQGKGAAKMVVQIMKGTNPADIPADTKPKMEMTINLKEAKNLGMSIPFELLGTAKMVR
ncbi:MAG: hypothetical protein KJ950_14945 [Proteobacteria bacterium]|nr:hypothetical protein [Pseudomonadota bacterium]MBU1688632.1 hypothetical protein [Pseudomonadota bacterium]